MAETVSYGMGQYLFTKNYEYMTQLSMGEPTEYIIENASQTKYKDISIKLPVTDSNVPIVQYGQTYFLELSVPRNRQYTMTLNLKLCPADSENNLVLDRFQQINRIEIPPTPEDDNIYEEVLLYENPFNDKVAVALIDNNHDDTLDLAGTHNSQEVYKAINEDNGEIEYRYYNAWNEYGVIKNFNSIKVIRSWELKDTVEDIATYKFAFSPKYNLTEGYSYLLIETDRNNLWTNEIQYVDNDDTYNGTYLDLNSVSAKLYIVNNLLEGVNSGTSQIKSGTNVLSHIGIWGHPEQIIVINGEEIKIGRTGFYEIKDYDITFLGMVVQDYNTDRFTIDYEYKISNE